MSFPFMDIDDYRRLHPEIGKSMSEEPTANAPSVFNVRRTPAQVVGEVSSKGQNQIGNAMFDDTEEVCKSTGVITYACRARLMKFSGEGRSRSKKVAKQKACFELIKSAIEMDRYLEFLIPANSKAEAHAMLEKIKPEDEELNSEGTAQPTAQPVNWVGKLEEFCTQNKMPTADYSFSQSGPTNNMTFTVHAKIRDTEVSADGKKKNLAKTAAAQKLYLALVPQVAELKKAQDRIEGLELGTEPEEDEKIEGILGKPGVDVSQAQTDPKPQETLKGILSDEIRFLANYDLKYRDLVYPSTRGRSQTLLTVKYSKAPPQPIKNPDGSVSTPKVDKDAPSAFTYVFCGEGEDADLARDEAARAALLHFLTLKGPREPSPATPAPSPATPTPSPAAP